MTTNEPEYTPKPLPVHTRDELLAMVDPEVVDRITAMLDGGLKIAVYENNDLGHPDLGRKVFLSYGGPTSTWQEPPPFAPDTAEAGLGWRYLLAGTCPS